MSASEASTTDGSGSKVEERALSDDIVGFGPGQIRKLTDDVYIAGQITEAQIVAISRNRGQLASIMNLRREGEGTYLNTEADLCKALGVAYVAFPMHPSTVTHKLMDEITAQLDKLPKPVLVHCASAMRAGAIAVAYEATRRQLPVDATVTLASKTPFGRTTNQAFRQLVAGYAEERLAMITDLPNIVQITDELVVGPTVTADQMKALAAAGKMKTVISLRSPDEVGSLGLGVAAIEEELVKGLGLVFVNIPTTAGEVPPPETVAAIQEALEAADKPVFMHCRRMRRTAAVVRALGLSAMPSVALPEKAGGSAKEEAGADA